MTGETLNYKRYIAITFGQFFQIHEEETPRNNTRPRTRGDVCMSTSRNKQREFEFMTLGSIKKVVRRSWDSLPMPNTMIARVNVLGQGILNDLDLLYCEIRPIGELDIPGVYYG